MMVIESIISKLDASNCGKEKHFNFYEDDAEIFSLVRSNITSLVALDAWKSNIHFSLLFTGGGSPGEENLIKEYKLVSRSSPN